MDLKVDVERWLRESREAQRKLQVEQCNAICPNCGADVLDALWEATNDWDGGDPSLAVFECPGCGEELEYTLEWVTELYRAHCISCKGVVVGG